VLASETSRLSPRRVSPRGFRFAFSVAQRSSEHPHAVLRTVAASDMAAGLERRDKRKRREKPAWSWG
jgi:hypothetical protein